MLPKYALSQIFEFFENLGLRVQRDQRQVNLPGGLSYLVRHNGLMPLRDFEQILRRCKIKIVVRTRKNWQAMHELSGEKFFIACVDQNGRQPDEPALLDYALLVEAAQSYHYAQTRVI